MTHPNLSLIPLFDCKSENKGGYMGRIALATKGV
jgi:hypothetical protein